MDQLSAHSALGAQADLMPQPAITIGAATLYPDLRELRGGGATVRLEPRALQVLLVLADAAGRAVTRKALFRTCWNGAIVDESALNRVISQIRRASAQTGLPFTVHTVTKLGYRLEPNGLPGREHLVGTRNINRRNLLLAGGVLAAAGTGLFALAWPSIRQGGEATELERRAKLALADMLPARDSEAIAMLTEAAALDPQRPTVWGTLALAHQRAAELGPASQAGASAEQARAAARQALALDPGNADALAALALIAPVYRNWLAAEKVYADLGARFPNHAPLLAGHAKLLAEVGRFKEAMALFDRIFEIEPLSPVWHWRRGMGLWAANRPGESLQLLERALRIWPNHPSIWAATFWVNAYTGSIARSISVAALPVARSVPEPQLAFMKRSMAALSSTDPRERREILSANRQSAAGSTSMAEHAMAVAAALGDKAEAMAIANAYHFGEGFSVRDGRLEPGTNMAPDRRKTLPLFWPPMARLRGDARFSELVRRLGLSSYWAESGSRPDAALV